MFKIRANTPPMIQEKNRVVTTDIRSGYLNGSPAKRLIIHFHSTGCGWARQAGGCTMCGFYAATTGGIPIATSEYEEQFAEVFSRFNLAEFPVLGLYNAGNILNEEEMPFEALEKICLRIAQNPYIRRISIESKPEYIDPTKIKRISSILRGKEIELGMGVESLNEKIKDVCINKPYPNSFLKKKVDLLLRLGIVPKAYLLLKPPFLTEKETIDDFLQSYRQLQQMGIQRIDCETMTIEDHTLVYHLWKQGYYRTPWLWSLLYLLEQLRGFRLYFTPFRYIVSSLAIAHNCDECSERVMTRLFEYQEGKLTLDELLAEDCACKAEWRAELAKTDERPIEERIIQIFPSLRIE